MESLCSALKDCTMNSIHSTNICIITGKIIIQPSHGQSGPGKSASIQLYSGTQVDQTTGKGKLSRQSHLKHGKTSKNNLTKIRTYEIKFNVEPNFGIPGAFLVKSRHKHKFFLQSATLKLSDEKIIHFDCNSWIYPIDKTEKDRLFFSNTSYLPNQTPKALVQLRKEELASLRGDGTGERKEWERIYDYDYYNDLGNPDKGSHHTRPVLGGSEMYPYPRRGRTGSPPSHQGSRQETINLDIYVPPDERFSQKKLSEFIDNTIQATLHFLLPEAKSLFQENTTNFESFEEIHNLYTGKRNQVVEGWVTEKLKTLVPSELLNKITHASKEKSMGFPLPQIIAGENKLAWKDDEEFGRQMLAGMNPAVIQCLEKFPPRSKNAVKSSINASDIEKNLDGLTLHKAMLQWRILMLDYHDHLMPFLDRINTKGVCAYASRTLLFIRNDATLKPLAIELSLPGSSSGEETTRVFLPSSDQGSEAALWQLAKAHVAVNDSGYHQLISHWLKTHAVIEPFIIATRRQLSVMHPIHRLLDPHFKDTMHINALARSILLKSGGILEKTLFTEEISMEFSSSLYKDWKFSDQSLPSDLVKRGMAFEDEDKPSGVQLLFEDYPYGADGLDIWVAIKTWVQNFCSIFYANDDSVKSDSEIQEWWSEIRNVGHGDKRKETWWSEMTTRSDLIETLTTLIWTASALHAAVNYGQYGYAGYPPNHPTMCRKFIPKEGTLQFAEFLTDPDKFYLKMLPERFEMTLSIALLEVLSQHTKDEVYLGQRVSPDWTDNEEIRRVFKQFGEDLKEVDKRILERNRNPALKNRWGPARIPYKLLYPDASSVRHRGGTKGIPNSVSI